MKNKKITTWFLALAVLVVWGIIIYQVVMRNPERTPVARVNPVKENKQAVKKFEYKLLPDYPDPFFPKRKYHTEIEGSNPAPPKDPPPVWPNLKYYGCISTDEQTRALVSVEGRSVILKPQDVLADKFVLKQIVNDSILIATGNEKKWFKK